MKDSTYNEKIYGLHTPDCEWLRKIGLKETLWIIDREWILHYYNNIIFNRWIRK